MSVANPRKRLVYFRVSEDEFQKLASMCQGGEGGRSISDLARSAVNRLVADRNGVTTVDERIESLRVQVQMLTELLTGRQQTEESGIPPREAQAAHANGSGGDGD